MSPSGLKHYKYFCRIRLQQTIESEFNVKESHVKPNMASWLLRLSTTFNLNDHRSFVPVL